MFNAFLISSKGAQEREKEQLGVIWSCLSRMYSFVVGTELSLNRCSTGDTEYWHLEKGEAGVSFIQDLEVSCA